MVADVRFKVRMRLRAFIRRMGAEFAANGALRASLRAAPESPAGLEALKKEWRGKLEAEFPGCEITCTSHRVYIKLPDAYPASGVPISEVYPSAFAPVLFGHPGDPIL